MIKTRNDECSEANEHEHSPHCEEEHPECDFLSKYRFVFFQSLSSKLIWGMSMILLIFFLKPIGPLMDLAITKSILY